MYLQFGIQNILFESQFTTKLNIYNILFESQFTTKLSGRSVPLFPCFEKTLCLQLLANVFLYNIKPVLVEIQQFLMRKKLDWQKSSSSWKGLPHDKIVLVHGKTKQTLVSLTKLAAAKRVK